MNDINIEFHAIRQHELEREARNARLAQSIMDTNRANAFRNARQVIGRNLIALGERLSDDGLDR